MMLLIHGYATWTRFSVFREAHTENAGLYGFIQPITDGVADVFAWGIQTVFSFWDCINPWKQYWLYTREREEACDPHTIRELQEKVQTQTFDTIVCHSMGSLVLMEYLKQHDLPKTVKQIVFVQADIARKTVLGNKDVQTRLTQGTLTFTNLYCPYDQSLLLSCVLQRALRAGQFGWKQQGVKNIFFPLTKLSNLHSSSVQNPKLYAFIQKQTEEMVF